MGAKAPADGYTITLGSVNDLAIAPALNPKLGYDIARDFQPVTQYTTTTLVLITGAHTGVGSIDQLITLAKAQPGSLSYASFGPATTAHIAGELLKKGAGIDVLHVPYKAVPEVQVALIGGQVQIGFDFPATVSRQVKAGDIRALLVTSARRVPLLPDVPTAREAGLPDMEISSWGGFLVPRGTPGDVVARLNTELVKILHTPEVKADFERNGQEAVGSSPEEFAAFIRAEQLKWARLIRLTGITLEQWGERTRSDHEDLAQALPRGFGRDVFRVSDFGCSASGES